MGTSNFARGNASKVFAVLMDREEKYSKCTECDEKHFEWDSEYIEEGGVCECGCTDIEHGTEYRSCEDFEVSDFKNYIQETAQEKKGNFKYQEEKGSDNDRNYCATYLFSFSAYKSFGDIEVECKITASMVGAYYEGASLDWTFEIYNGGEWVAVERGYYTTTEEDIVKDLFAPQYEHYQSDMNQGMRRIQMGYATNWAEKETDKMIELIEDIFTEVSMPLNVVASFSNGETHYAKA